MLTYSWNVRKSGVNEDRRTVVYKYTKECILSHILWNVLKQILFWKKGTLLMDSKDPPRRVC